MQRILKQRLEQILFFSVFIFGFGFCSTVFAQSKAQKAQKYFEDGAALFFKEDYGSAISKFKLGHALVPNALFPYNISLCHQRMGNFTDALESAEEAHEMGGLGEIEIPNLARIVALKRIVKLTSIPWPQPEVDIEKPTVMERKRWGAVGWVGVGATVLGAGLLAGAVLTEVELQETFDAYNQAADDGNENEFNRLRGEVDSLQTRGKILLYAGGGLAIIGATLVIIDLATVEVSQPRVSVFPTKDGFNASFGWTF